MNTSELLGKLRADNAVSSPMGTELGPVLRVQQAFAVKHYLLQFALTMTHRGQTFTPGTQLVDCLWGLLDKQVRANVHSLCHETGLANPWAKFPEVCAQR